MLAAAVSAFIVIALLLKFLQTHTFTPFVIYRIAGVAVILVFSTGLR